MAQVFGQADAFYYTHLYITHFDGGFTGVDAFRIFQFQGNDWALAGEVAEHQPQADQCGHQRNQPDSR